MVELAGTTSVLRKGTGGVVVLAKKLGMGVVGEGESREGREDAGNEKRLAGRAKKRSCREGVECRDLSACDHNAERNAGAISTARVRSPPSCHVRERSVYRARANGSSASAAVSEKDAGLKGEGGMGREGEKERKRKGMEEGTSPEPTRERQEGKSKMPKKNGNRARPHKSLAPVF